ncbi:hypothetical protein SAY87_003367 [Trapa incisa]|uniref:Uncharacterized protein n=1 Tax=Trapa incisa TaxID=236973 RepID=A0AAN7QHL0_9MYRT|nr:hypothetical protein SAY87_003367 [Trapa incisa]
MQAYISPSSSRVAFLVFANLCTAWCLHSDDSTTKEEMKAVSVGSDHHQLSMASSSYQNTKSEPCTYDVLRSFYCCRNRSYGCFTQGGVCLNHCPAS